MGSRYDRYDVRKEDHYWREVGIPVFTLIAISKKAQKVMGKGVVSITFDDLDLLYAFCDKNDFIIMYH